MSNQPPLTNNEIMALRIELFVAEMRRAALHAQLERAGDHAFLTALANGQSITEVPDCL